MSGGFGLPVLNLQDAIGKVGTAYTDAYDKSVQQGALAALGTQLQAGNYAGAAKTAFDAGDAATGLSLIKLGQTADQAKQASVAFGGLAGLYGGGGGGAMGLGGPTGTPSFGISRGGAAPSFLDLGGPSGGYLAGLIQRESGGNPNARASTSTATGLGQFTDRTWTAVMRAHPELGLTPEGRTDPDQSVRALKAFTADNSAGLQKAGLPVNDSSLYASHFLGASGGPRFVAGAMQNPDAPAASYVDPRAVAANRNVFFNRDGSPKSAGQVMGDFGRSFGGGGRAAPAAQAAAAPVRVASTDPDSLTLPSGASGLNPAVAAARPAPAPAPFVAIPGGGAGAPTQDSPEAAIPTLAQPALARPRMQIPGAEQDGGGDGISAAVAPPSVTAPNREQISAQAPQHLERAGLPPAAAVAIGNTAPGSQQRVAALMRVAGLPGLNEGQSGVVKALLANELEQTKLPEVQRNYLLARSQGFNGSIIDYQNELRKPLTPTTVAPGTAVIFPGERAPAYINPKDEKGFTDVTDPGERRAAGVPDWYTGSVQRGPDNRIYYPGAGQQGVTPEQKLQNSADQKLSEAKVAPVVAAIEAAKPASERLATLATLADAWKSGDGKITTGPLGEGALKLKQFAQGTLGINTSGLTETELVQKVGTQLAAQASKDLTSRPTQFDFQVFLANNPGINLSPQGNLSLISLMQQKAKHDLQLAALARQQKNGDNWDEVVAKFDKEHPVISPLTGRPLDPNEVIFPGPAGTGGQQPGGAQGAGQSAQQLKPMGADLMGEARAAIRDGRPAAAVIQRLRERGFDPAGL